MKRRSRQSSIRMRDSSGRFTRTITSTKSARRKRKLKRSPEARAKGRVKAVISTLKSKGMSSKQAAKFLSKTRKSRIRKPSFGVVAGAASIAGLGVSLHNSYSRK